MRPHILVPLLLLTLLCAAPAGAAPAAPATEHAPSSLYDSSSPTMPAGAISVHPYAHEQLADGDSLDDYDSEPLTSIADPLEPWNRFWFAFNDIFFLHVAKPVYNFYETVVPQPVHHKSRIARVRTRSKHEMNRLCQRKTVFTHEEGGIQRHLVVHTGR